MILHVEQKVALTLEGRRLTDDLGENIRTAVLRSNLGWEDLSFGLSLLNESCLVLSMEITLDARSRESDLDRSIVVTTND